MPRTYEKKRRLAGLGGLLWKVGRLGGGGVPQYVSGVQLLGQEEQAGGKDVWELGDDPPSCRNRMCIIRTGTNEKCARGKRDLVKYEKGEEGNGGQEKF